VFQVPTEARRLLDAALGELGWPADEPVHVLVARLDRLPDALHPDVGIAAEPDDAWLGRFRDGAGRAPAARGVLTRHERACFASVRRDDATVAIGRGTLDAGWLGVTAVEVDPRYRRQGLARAVMGALAGWGRAQGAVRAHLEVTAANTAAVALYESLGYWRHHDYHYRREPAS
jgi:ribosomal protein S18 acetylase RimI-like enzyme